MRKHIFPEETYHKTGMKSIFGDKSEMSIHYTDGKGYFRLDGIKLELIKEGINVTGKIFLNGKELSLIGADGGIVPGGSVAWVNVTGVPSTFPPSVHNHDSSYYTKVYFDSLFQLVGTVPNQYIRCKYPFAGDYEIQAFSDTGWLPPSIWESLPAPSTVARGGVLLGAGSSKFYREDGTWQDVVVGSSMVYPPAGIPVSTGAVWGSSITPATGYMRYTGAVWEFKDETYSLSAHLHTGTYQPLDGDLTAIAGLAGVVGFAYKTAANTWSLDTTAYLSASIFNSLFELTGTAPDQYIRCKYPFAGDYEIQAFSDTGWLPPSIWDSLPAPSTVARGGVLLGVGSSKFYREDGTWQTVTGGAVAEAYETVSKNLKTYPYTIVYNSGAVSTMTYNLGGGQSIIKTFSYTSGVLTSIVLSGNTPSGIQLTKTLGYTGTVLTSITYS